MKQGTLCMGLWLMFILVLISGQSQAQTFDYTTLNFNGFSPVTKGTSLKFGPDNRLYVLNIDGSILVYTIQRVGPKNYTVTAVETINSVRNIPNHNDDGAAASSSTRLATGLTVGGTASSPVIYVSSSDPRVGGSSRGDVNLDTNSGIITRMTKNGSSWTVVDLVRGLPRSEENHATNGLELVTINNVRYLLASQGGHTNGGAPSAGFGYLTEYALASVVLAINLDALNALPVKQDGNRQYIYDLPTLDDPTRSNANGINDPSAPGYDGIDIGDPWGGNDGLNQAKLVAGGPVQIFAGGFRNTYDLAVTQGGAVFVTENGANQGWGGLPINEGMSGTATNGYDPNETGTGNGNKTADGEQVNNLDHLALVTLNVNTYTFGSHYSGHPTPVRANPTASGLYTRGTHSFDHDSDAQTDGEFFRKKKYNPNSTDAEAADPKRALPADWPPVPENLKDTREGDWRGPAVANPDGAADVLVTTWVKNTNGIDEYTASSFGGLMKGNLIAGCNTGSLHRVQLNSNGTLKQLEENKYSTSGGNPLGVDCLGDAEAFPGTIWVATFDNRIVVFEPNEGLATCTGPGDAGYNPQADNDSDGYKNDDEIQNGTNHCDGASFPDDYDGDLVSDLLDEDDDGDGILDKDDPFQLGGGSFEAFDVPYFNDLFSDQSDLGGYRGMGFTGLMNNGSLNPNYLPWLDDPDASDTDVDDIYGGAAGLVTLAFNSGDARNNNQEKGFQFGVKVGQTTGKFLVEARMQGPFHPLVAGQSEGIFIGTGDQDNYIKFVHGPGGLEVASENFGTYTSIRTGTITTPNSDLEFFLEIDPVANTIQASYSVNDGPRTNLGTPFAAQGPVLDAIRQLSKPLAVGLIGTSGAQSEFIANYDLFRVTKLEAPSAVVEVLPTSGINSSTFSTGSFSITNTSTTSVEITSVTLNIASSLLPETVYDPLGTAGDLVKKPFTVDQTGGTGTITHMLSQAYGNGGFRELKVNFTDFDPGETMTFSIDVDPTSTEGLPAPGPGDAGSVSGLELVGSRITVTFSDGSEFLGTLFSAGTQGGSRGKISQSPPAAPTIAVQNVASTPAVVNNLNQTLLISGGPANGKISLLQVEGGFFDDGLDLDQQAFETNTAIFVKRTTNISLSASGTASIPVVLSNLDPNNGAYNYFAVAVHDGTEFGLLSNIVLLKYDANAQTAGISGTTGIANCGGRTAEIRIYSAGGSSLVRQANVNLTTNGEFTINDLAPGTYDIFVKPAGHLRTKMAGQTLISGANLLDFGPFKGGDSDDDNTVNLNDYYILRAAFGLMSGNGGYDVRADVNCSNSINLSDYFILRGSFGQSGVFLPN